MTKKYIKEYALTLINSLFLVLFISVYMYFRQGEYGLVEFNKVTADTAFVLIGIVFLIGPLSRIFDLFDGWLKYRKELGVLAFLYSFIHGFTTYFLMPERFPRSGFTLENTAFVFGASSLIILFILFLFSYDTFINLLNRKFWWFIQNWGIRIVTILILLHLFYSKKEWWISWWEGKSGRGAQGLPAVSLLVGVFILFVFIIRFIEFFPKSTQRFLTILAFISYIAVTGLLLTAAI